MQDLSRLGLDFLRDLKKQSALSEAGVGVTYLIEKALCSL